MMQPPPLTPASSSFRQAWPVGGSPTHAKRSRHGSLLGHGPLSPRSLQAEQSRQAALARAGGCPRFSLRRLVILVAALAGGSWALCLFCLGVGVVRTATCHLPFSACVRLLMAALRSPTLLSP